MRYSTSKYTVASKPGLRSPKVIKNETIQSVTHDFLLTFHSNHRPISHRFRYKRRFPSKIANFFTAVYFAPLLKGLPLEFGIGVRGPKCLDDEATRWSKKFSDRFSRLDTIPAVTDSQPRCRSYYALCYRVEPKNKTDAGAPSLIDS